MTTTFSERLSELLEEKYLTATAFADEIGVSFSIVAEWIRENPPVKLSNLLKIAAFFDCSVDYVCGRTDIRGKFSPTRPTFPVPLKVLIEKYCKSKAAAFEKIGMNRHALYDWQKGSLPLSTNLMAIADYFDCSVDYLVGIENAQGQ